MIIVARGDQMVYRLMLALAVVGAFAGGLTGHAWSSQSDHLRIDTSKPPGPVSGTFAASGAFSDSGTINNLSFRPSARGAPNFQITHVTILFTGTEGSFTLKAQIVETVTSDPNVLTDNGTWTVVAGTGAYAKLHGHGSVLGTVDENVNLITRSFEGDVHFD